MSEGRQLRGISGQEAVNAFVRAGGRARRGKGGHVTVKMPNGRLITIPQHRELKVGLLNAAIRRAEMTKTQFIDLL